MRFDLNLRSVVKEQMRELAKEMQTWQVQTRIDETEVERISNSIGVFEHTTSRTDLRVAGVDGSGDFPILTYADSFVYLSSFIPRSFPSYRPPIGEYMYSLDELLEKLGDLGKQYLPIEEMGDIARNKLAMPDR